MTDASVDGRLADVSLAGAAWLTAAPVQQVLTTLEASGFSARVVGGAVRNSLLGLPVKDVDVATTALPDEVMAVAEKAQIKALPTGLSHGTVTLVIDRVPVEVTTLRRDTETDGRHAVVAYTDSWAEDAARRDFTINALYCDASGAVFDPAWRVSRHLRAPCTFYWDRGRANSRRLFAHSAFLPIYKLTLPMVFRMQMALRASVLLASGMEGLSPERIRAELLRLFQARAAHMTVAEMERAGFWPRILGNRADLRAFRRLVALEDWVNAEPSWLRRLAALSGVRSGLAGGLQTRLRLSNDETDTLAQMVIPDKGLLSESALLAAKAYIYRFGAAAFRNGLLISWGARGRAN